MDPNGAAPNAKIVTLMPASSTTVVDPLLGKPVWIEGLLYFDRPQPHPARMVDLEPYGPTARRSITRTSTLATHKWA